MYKNQNNICFRATSLGLGLWMGFLLFAIKQFDLHLPLVSFATVELNVKGVELAKTKVVEERYHCNATLGPTCAFRKVCLNWVGPRSLSLVAFGEKDTNSTYPPNLVLHTGLDFGWIFAYLDTTVTVNLSTSLETCSDDNKCTYQPGITTLASLIGAENIGHHIYDNWFRFYQLKQFGERVFGTKPSHLYLIGGCKGYDYRVPWYWKKRAMSWFHATCERFAASFFPASEYQAPIHVFPALNERRTMCFDGLITGTLKMLGTRRPSPKTPLTPHLVNVAKSFESYRDDILSSYGLDPNYKPTRKRIIVQMKKFASAAMDRFVVQPEAFSHLIQTLRDDYPDHEVDVVQFEDYPMKEQMAIVMNATVAIFTGGGAAFMGMFIGKGSHLIVAPYHFECESDMFRPAHCFAKVDYYRLVSESNNYNNDTSGWYGNYTFPVQRITRLIREGQNDDAAISCTAGGCLYNEGLLH